MSRWRLALFLVVVIPLLARLAYQAGFRETFTWKDSLVDGFVAYAVGFAASAVFLWLFTVLERDMNAREVVGKISLQAVPAGIGAVLARSLLELRAVNNGSGAAANVEVRAGLTREGQEVESGRTVFDYIPGGSERQGGIFFTSDPRLYNLELDVGGYQKP